MGALAIRVFFLKLDQNRYFLFEETVNEEFRFSQPVDDFELSRSLPLLCFVLDDQDRITYVALAKKGMRAGTDLRRLNIIDPVKLKEPIPSDDILEEISGKVKAHVIDKISYGGLLPPKSSEYFIDTVIDLFPHTESLLSQYSKRSRERFNRLGVKTRKLLGQQKDAVATAMTIAGIDRGYLRSWSLKGDSAPESFLDGLENVYLLEDQVIANDLSTFPGYDFLRSQTHGSTVFQDARGNKLTVVLANRLPLEKQTGTDLIYFNETFKSFVMVQYKMMDSDDGKAIFRFPNKQFSEELKRMDDLLIELQKVQPDTHHNGFRLNPNPFFLKFCPRIDFDPSNEGLAKGMYLHLDHWKMLEVDKDLAGVRGGKQLSYENVGRYLDNTSFVTLVSKAWIGSTINQSNELQLLVKEIISSGRTLVFAVKEQSQNL